MTNVTDRRLGQTVSTRISDTVLSKRALLGGLTATLAMAAAPSLLRGAGNFRSIALVNDRTDEWLKTVYWADGDYIPEAMDAINRILRDWRADRVCKMDAKTIDILSATQRLLDCSEPFEVVSGYRTASTNAMLRRKSRGVAKNSYHIKGMAVDIAMKTRSVSQISRAGLSLNAGGVGRYSRSDFVHLDSGPVRKWGR